MLSRKFQNFIIGSAAIASFFFLIYLFFYIGKNLSYYFLYEDLVKETIKEVILNKG